MSAGHVPVLRDAFLQAAGPAAGQCWVDGTFGRGGYAEALLRRGVRVLALDWDDAAEVRARELRTAYGPDFEWRNVNFAEMKTCCVDLGWKQVDGIVLDLGVSSPQLDTPERGFSFRAAGPLDMRMDRRGDLTAAGIVNEWSEEELGRIFYEYGEERDARRAARAIVARRRQRLFVDTLDLAGVVAGALPRRAAQRIHPATKVFQALRIAVNREPEALTAVLPLSATLLRPGGVFAVVSFHSGEDRVVKNFMRDHQREFLDRPESPEPVRNPERWFDRVQRLLPDETELAANPRCRSARLRLAWRAGEGA